MGAGARGRGVQGCPPEAALRGAAGGPGGGVHGDAPAAAPEAAEPVSPCVCVLAGSPRRDGASAALAACIARGVGRAGCRADLVLLADFAVAGCTGCGTCESTGACVLDAGERRAAAAGGRPPCAALRARLDAADGLALVSPVYFSGPPSQLKAFFDRMQPLWAQRYLLRTRPVLPPGERRPLDLFVVGSGGDPFGYDALVSCARSSLRMADFELRALHDCVGYRALSRSATPKPADADAATEGRATAAGEELARWLQGRA